MRLLTLPRILGYIFNPISIYFCSDAQDTPLCAIAEVGNTYRESKLFLLPRQARTAAVAGAARFKLRVPKQYYVSPFSSLDICFDFDLRLPGPHAAAAYRGLGRATASCSTATCAAPGCRCRTISCCALR